jgi:hypothetical protein
LEPGNKAESCREGVTHLQFAQQHMRDLDLTLSAISTQKKQGHRYKKELKKKKKKMP